MLRSLSESNADVSMEPEAIDARFRMLSALYAAAMSIRHESTILGRATDIEARVSTTQEPPDSKT